MALTEGRRSPVGQGIMVDVPVAAGATIYEGGMACANASGYLVPASDTAGLSSAVVSQGYKDNSAGADGDKSLTVMRGRTSVMKNSVTNPVTQAHVFKDVFVEDDETVASSSTNSIVAGRVLGITADGILLFFH